MKFSGNGPPKKFPLIAGVELAINQSCNAPDWLLSFKRMNRANEINGKVMEAARN